jgi:cysteine desulfurase
MDNHATTRVDPRVVEAMLPFFDSEYGNAASRTHVFGWRAEEAVTRARARIARPIGADPKEIVFTSGATESNNLAIFGAFEALRGKGDHVVTGATEHNAVLDPLEKLQSRGARVTILPVDGHGRVDPDEVRRAITDRTVLVSLMFANNEVGTIHPIAAIGRICREKGVLFHSDAAQAIGKVPVDVQALGIDLLSMSAHKIYGPKGVGALYVRRKNPRVILEPILFGGGHERGLRSGTLNVPGIVGFGAALEIAARDMPEESQRLRVLRDRLHEGIAGRLDDVVLNGHPVERLPNNLNLSFAYVEGEALMMALDGIAVSSGSACTSARKEPSHVLRAMGKSDDQAVTSIRFGLGRFSTRDEVDYVVERVEGAVRRLRAISPLYEAARAGARMSTH